MKTKPLSQSKKSSVRAAVGAGRTQPLVTSAPVAPAEPFIKKPEVARRLGLTVRTVETMMQHGKIPYYKFGCAVSFRWSEITEHLARTCRVSPVTNSKAETLKPEKLK